MRRFLVRLRAATDGSPAIEFGLLAPLIFAMLLGVIQIGVGMWNYNALRGIAADVGRQVAVEYQKENQLTNAQIETIGTATAVQAPYMLSSDSVVVTVEDADPQRVADAKELTFTITYTVPSVLTPIDIPDIPISFSRPIFLAV